MLRLENSLVPFALLVFTSTTLNAQTAERIDVNDQGQPAFFMMNSSGTAPRADISDDGRFAVFVSYAGNLVPGDGPGYDLFLRDRLLSHTQIVSVPGPWSSASVSYNADPRISGDGSTITYSRGTGFNNNSPYQSFVYVRATGLTTPIIVPHHTDIHVDALSFDGTFAAVVARTTTDSTRQVYRLHIPTGALVLCSRDVNGNPAGGLGNEGFSADIDANGTHVAFTSSGAQLVAGPENGYMDAYVYDVPGNVVMRASQATSGVEGAGATISCSIDGGGRFLALESLAPNLVPSDVNQRSDLFLRDTHLGLTEIESITAPQVPNYGGLTSRAFISRDASAVLFSSQATFGINPTMYVRDVESGYLLSLLIGSPLSIGNSVALGISGDGRKVLFSSDLGQWVGPNGGVGIFVTDWGPRCSTSGYCTSLPNSTGQAATIGATGSASKQLDNLVISAVGLPDNTNALLFSGTSSIDPGAPFGNGLLCVGGSLIRHGIQIASGGVILDAQNVHGVEYVGVNPGDTRYYQVVYRDVPAGGALFNTTDGVAVTFCW